MSAFGPHEGRCVAEQPAPSLDIVSHAGGEPLQFILPFYFDVTLHMNASHMLLCSNIQLFQKILVQPFQTK